MNWDMYVIIMEYNSRLRIHSFFFFAKSLPRERTIAISVFALESIRSRDVCVKFLSHSRVLIRRHRRCVIRTILRWVHKKFAPSPSAEISAQVLRARVRIPDISFVYISALLVRTQRSQWTNCNKANPVVLSRSVTLSSPDFPPGADIISIIGVIYPWYA